MQFKNESIFLGLLDFNGYLSAISSGMKGIGIKSFHLHLGNNSHGHYGAYDQNLISKFFIYSRKIFFNSRNSKKTDISRYIKTSLYLISTVIIITWIICKFKVVYFKAGESFLDSKCDIHLFKFFGIKTIAHYAGSDSRPPYLNANICKTLTADRIYDLTKKQKEKVHHVNKVFDIIIDNPLAGHFHSKKCVIGQCLGTIVNTEWINDVVKSNPSISKSYSKIKVTHFPSDRALKGSDVILAEMNKLVENGQDIIYKEVSGVTNIEVILEMANSDIVIDELYSDSIGATVTTEAAVLSVPSISCSYGVNELKKFLPDEVIIPNVLIHPSELRQSITKLVKDRNMRCELGKKASEFVKLRNNEDQLARRLYLIANNNIPENWFFDPYEITYVGGVAGPEDDTKKGIRKLLEYGGSESLCLDDKPELRDKIISFAKSN